MSEPEPVSSMLEDDEELGDDADPDIDDAEDHIADGLEPMNSMLEEDPDDDDDDA